VTLGRVLVVVLLVGLAATGAATQPASAADEPWPTYVPVTNAEKRATRPIAEAVVEAYRFGRFSALCAIMSPTQVRRVYRTIERCRRSVDRATHPCTNRCVFRLGTVIGAYVTEADKAQRKKTLAWLYVMKSRARSGSGELEIRIRKEAGRWILVPNIVEAWSG
jgi:hypothetical protein